MSAAEIERSNKLAPIDHIVTLGERATAVDILRRAFYGPWLAGDQPSMRCTDIPRSIAFRATLPEHLSLDRSVVDDSGVHAVARGAGTTVMVDVVGGSSYVQVSAATDEQADALLEELVALWGPEQSPEIVDLKLWHHRASRKRRVLAPLWSEVERNYPPASRAQLNQLMNVERPQGMGKLILWHGPPGTGKTSAIRALARAWSPWCGVHYLADPEQLFHDPDYMIQVLESAPNAESRASLDTVSQTEGAWQLVVAEDTDEYLLSAGGSNGGGSLGRILNLTDGLLGQSFNALLLLTTNEDITRLHPALTRPGRCLADVAFEPFTRTQASDWIGEPVRPLTASTLTLAELFLASGDLTINSAVTDESKDRHGGMYL